MSIFDTESFYDYCSELVKANIDTKIDEINAEKADAIILEKPDANDFVYDFSVQRTTPDFFFFYTLTGERPLQTNGDKVSMEISMIFYAAFVDNDVDDAAIRKGLRYSRALREIFLEDHGKQSKISDLEIISHLPESAQFQNTKKWYKIGGIEIKGSIYL